MARTRGKFLPVFDVAGECALTAVQVDARYGMTQAQQRHRDMHRRGGFSGAAFLIAEHNDMGVARLIGRTLRHNRLPQFRCHSHHQTRPRIAIASAF